MYAAVLKAINGSAGGALLATAIHDAKRHKALALTPLLDEQDRPASVDSREVRFEIGILVDHLTASVLAALTDTAGIRIARCQYRIGELRLAGTLTYAELAAAANPQAQVWSLRVVTALAFETAREEGARRLRVLPEPEWVFGSLLGRWRALAPGTPLPDSTAEAIAGNLTIADWSLRRADHLVLAGDPKTGRKEMIWRGSVGEVTYRLADADSVDEAARAGLDALACFAGYAGVGDRTNVGMGCVRVLTRARREDR